jgi:hypothetical protein
MELRAIVSGRRRLFSGVTQKKAPGRKPGAFARAAGLVVYRLAWRLAPPLGPLAGPLPGMSPLETSLTQSEPLPL